MRSDIEPFCDRADALAFEIVQYFTLVETEMAANAIKREDPALDHPVDRRLRDDEHLGYLVDCQQFLWHEIDCSLRPSAAAPTMLS